MTAFWRNWLSIWALGVAVFGVVLYGYGYAGTSAPAEAAFAVLGNPLPDEPDRYLRFAVALMGAVTLGWAVTFYAVFRAAWAMEPTAATPVWRLVTIGTVLWYAIDSTASCANGFSLNAASNTVLMVTYLIPVLTSRVLVGGTR